MKQYDENFVLRKFHMVKNPYGKISVGENYVRQKIHTAKNTTAKNSYGEKS